MNFRCISDVHLPLCKAAAIPFWSLWHFCRELVPKYWQEGWDVSWVTVRNDCGLWRAQRATGSKGGESRSVPVFVDVSPCLHVFGKEAVARCPSLSRCWVRRTASSSQETVIFSKGRANVKRSVFCLTSCFRRQDQQPSLTKRSDQGMLQICFLGESPTFWVEARG